MHEKPKAEEKPTTCAHHTFHDPNATPCDKTPTHTFKWPGKDVALICDEHLAELAKVADARILEVKPISKDAPAFVAPIVDDVVRDKTRSNVRGEMPR